MYKLPVYNKNNMELFLPNNITDQPALLEGLLSGAYSQNVVYMFWGLASETDRYIHVKHIVKF